jgi:hypothetical protein
MGNYCYYTNFMAEDLVWKVQIFPYAKEIFCYFIKVHFNIILLSIPGSSEWPLPCRPSNENPVHICHNPSACYMPRPFTPI